jgi:hypothetical protein
MYEAHFDFCGFSISSESRYRQIAIRLRCWIASKKSTTYMLVTASLHPNEAMDKLAAAHESAGDVERAESLYLRMLAWREGADQFQAGDRLQRW